MEKKPVRILLVEDNPADARLVKEMLLDAVGESSALRGFELVNAETLGQAVAQLKAGAFDLMLMDLGLPDSIGLETFVKGHAQAPEVPVVVLTGLADEATGFRAVQEGAQDYLVKGNVDGSLLARAIGFAIERQRPRSQTRREPTLQGRNDYRMVGESARFKAVLGLISTVAKTSSTSVLIQSETGTGKELIANLIHHSGSRREGPFIKLNCSAIPDSLLETEMFGYEKGAFTDAKQSKKGLFELADTGTIFLDEIGDMDLRLQPKLLQVLESRSFRKVGGVKSVQVDVRVIAATNKDLDAMVKEKRFREDLYYRLKVMVINMPPLRERKEDIIPLAEHFIRDNSDTFGKGLKTLSQKARGILLDYPWPGNVRELKNVIERAFILSDSGEISHEHLPHELLSVSPGPKDASDYVPRYHEMTLEELEQNYIRSVLDRVNGNKTKASELLGISRLTLREKLKKSLSKD